MVNLNIFFLCLLAMWIPVGCEKLLVFRLVDSFLGFLPCSLDFHICFCDSTSMFWLQLPCSTSWNLVLWWLQLSFYCLLNLAVWGTLCFYTNFDIIVFPDLRRMLYVSWLGLHWICALLLKYRHLIILILPIHNCKRFSFFGFLYFF